MLDRQVIERAGGTLPSDSLETCLPIDVPLNH